MSEILQQQETAANAQARDQASLNQTMRERLALTMDKSLPFDLECGKGACVISRKIKREDVGAGRNITCFEKAQTSIKFFKDLVLKEIASVGDKNAAGLLDIAKHIGLVSSITTTVGAPVISSVSGEIAVQFPLKEIHGEVKQTKARFTLSGCKEITFKSPDSTYNCTLLHGTDLENNAVFLRWTMNVAAAANKNEKDLKTEDSDAAANIKYELNPDINECVIIFNRSHVLNISTVLLPSTPTVEDKQDKALVGAFGSQFKTTPITIDPGVKFDVEYDATLFFLRRNFPVKRYVKSSGSDQGIINEHDITTQEAHIRKCTWETVYLYWVYEALYSVALSIAGRAIPIKINIALLQHDDMLLTIAHLAADVNKLFAVMVETVKEDKRHHHLANLVSPYNATIEGLTSTQYNADKYFGYKLTQWLLTTVEKCTMMIPVHDAGTPRSKNFRAQLKRVNCALSRSAIRTTYTTDVLLGLTRKSFIDPWGLIYDEDVGNLPEILKKYSLQNTVKNAGWAKVGTIEDKQVSVVINSTHMIRFTFHAFRRDFHGSNPVAVIKEMKIAASKPRRFKRSGKPSAVNRQSNDAIKRALQPVRGLQKSILLDPSAVAASSTGPFVFGAATAGPYSWNQQ